MRVILQERVAGLGKVGDQVTVKRGYGRNYLLPYSKAVLATPKNIEEFEKHRAVLEKKAAELLKDAQRQAQEMAALVLSIAARAGEEGKLFGSIGPREVVEAAKTAGYTIERGQVLMPTGPIRQIGEYEIQLQLHSEVLVPVKVNVVVAAE